MTMTSRQRFLAVLQGGKPIGFQPERLPVTTHWVTDYFLLHVAHLNEQTFYESCGLDPILSPAAGACRSPYPFPGLVAAKGRFR